MVTSPSGNALRDSFAERIARRALLIDGGLSTALEQRGAVFDSPLWTGQTLLDAPEKIVQAHRDFVDAGADVIITASYQLSRAGFERLGRSVAEADQALIASVRAGFDAVQGSSALVAASVGPYGAILHDGSEYRGNYGLTRDELVDFHVERLKVLAQASPDLFAIETIPDLLEVEALVIALESAPHIPAWLSVTIGPDGRLWSGGSLTDVVRAVTGSPQIVALGLNCLDPDLVEPALAELRDATDLPLVVYPNAGGTWSAQTGEWSVRPCEFTPAMGRAWLAAGASAIGGCCGVGSLALTTLGQALEAEAT